MDNALWNVYDRVGFQKKLCGGSSKNNLFLLFYSPQPQRQVRILIYRSSSIDFFSKRIRWVARKTTRTGHANTVAEL